MVQSKAVCGKKIVADCTVRSVDIAIILGCVLLMKFDYRSESWLSLVLDSFCSGFPALWAQRCGPCGVPTRLSYSGSVWLKNIPEGWRGLRFEAEGKSRKDIHLFIGTLKSDYEFP